MKLNDVRDFLRESIKKESEVFFGLKDIKWVDQVTNNWFDDQNNYDRRWEVINRIIPKVGRILDMAAGCGTFVLFGLQNGYDVWGIEREEWKREYFRRKVLASNYLAKYLNRVVAGVGEALPFQDESFDLVTTYQTLEHVQDVNMCIQELLRVLKPGGILYIKAPDYNCFFEPHYRVPFLPKMNKKLASVYLKFIGKPLLGLQTLQWVTEKKVVKSLRMSKYNVNIQRVNLYHSIWRQEKIRELLPRSFRNFYVIRFLDFVYQLKLKIAGLVKIGREEKNIDLWVTKTV